MPSGKIIDLIAERNQAVMIIECKRKLNGVRLFQAIGQALCYVAEYGNGAKPAIVSFTGNANQYAHFTCQALGIHYYLK